MKIVGYEHLLVAKECAQVTFLMRPWWTTKIRRRILRCLRFGGGMRGIYAVHDVSTGNHPGPELQKAFDVLVSYEVCRSEDDPHDHQVLSIQKG